MGNLPGKLPSDFIFVTGIDVKILSKGEILQVLPNHTSIQLDFPTFSEADQFAVLYWNGSAWVEITQTTKEDNISTRVDVDAANELYQIASGADLLYKVLTTEKIGTFVLVKK